MSVSTENLGEPRRVITGLNAEGKSTVLIDGPMVPLGLGSGGLAWRSEALPMDNSGTSDVTADGFGFDLMHSGGSVFMVMDFPAESQAFWHATDTTEYLVLISGEIVLELEDGEAHLKAGDVCATRGVVHSWRNDSGKPARAATVILPAHPVGNGRTV
jgi:quercetin dioxygenase-like cupin family protein